MNIDRKWIMEIDERDLYSLFMSLHDAKGVFFGNIKTRIPVRPQMSIFNNWDMEGEMVEKFKQNVIQGTIGSYAALNPKTQLLVVAKPYGIKRKATDEEIEEGLDTIGEEQLLFPLDYHMELVNNIHRKETKNKYEQFPKSQIPFDKTKQQISVKKYWETEAENTKPYKTIEDVRVDPEVRIYRPEGAREDFVYTGPDRTINMEFTLAVIPYSEKHIDEIVEEVDDLIPKEHNIVWSEKYVSAIIIETQTNYIEFQTPEGEILGPRKEDMKRIPAIYDAFKKYMDEQLGTEMRTQLLEQVTEQVYRANPRIKYDMERHPPILAKYYGL